MATVLVNYVVGDLTLGKPASKEFPASATLETAIAALADSSECGVPIWKPKTQPEPEDVDTRQRRFVGILYSLDLVAFLAKPESLENRTAALNAAVSTVVSPGNSLLKQVEPAMRIIDALEMMKQGVRRLLVPKDGVWQGLTKRFSVLYNGRWINNGAGMGSSSGSEEFCCLSREDMIRFLIGCLGSLAPLPLSPVSSLGMINFDFAVIHSCDSAMEGIGWVEEAIAVVEEGEDGRERIIGEISAYKLWKQDYLSVSEALTRVSAGEFVMGVDDKSAARAVHDISPADSSEGGSSSLKRFRSRGVGFKPGSTRWGSFKSRSAPLMCRSTSSLAAVMAQMLSHRASHVWVTEDDSGVLLGIVRYRDIFHAITSRTSCP